MNRLGLTGAIVGGAAAVGAAGVAAAATQQHRSIEKLRARAEASPAALGDLPCDRAGTVAADDGVALAYREIGPQDAPVTVVLTHGYTLAMRSWWFQWRDLHLRYGAGVRLVAYDQRSHGRSGTSPSEHATMDQLGADLATVIARRAPHGPLVVAGHSMGGMTVMALADREPGLFGPDGRVRGVALVCTSSGELSKLTFGLPGVLARMQQPLVGAALKLARWQSGLIERGRRVGRDLAWAYTQRLSFDDPSVDPALTAFVNDMIAATRVEVVADFFPALMSHDKADALAVLRDTPVELIGADHDVMLPIAHTRAIAEALPQARLTVIEDAGHLAMLDHPAEITAALERLVDRATREARPARRAKAG